MSLDKTPYRYWSRAPIEPNKVTTVKTVMYLMPRRMAGINEAAAIQATAYALLCYIQNNMFVEAKPLMLWLQTMRSFPDGFEATMVSRWPIKRI